MSTDTYTVTRTALEYQDVRSDKFYNVYILQGGDYPGVLMHYGRRHTDGQQKWHPTNTGQDAEVFGNRKLYEKRDGGYQASEPEEFGYESIGREPTVSRLMEAMRRSKREGSAVTVTNDLKGKAVELQAKVSELVLAVKRGEQGIDELVASLVVLEMSLSEAEDAIAGAKLGLELARTAVTQRVTA